MARQSVIIIGAGLAGLSAGCYCQMNGYRTRIFEHHSKPGGVATGWRRQDYSIDGGIHFLMGYRPGRQFFDLYRELGIVGDNPTVALTTYGRFTDETSGRSIDITGDLERTATDLRLLFPNDVRSIDQLFTGIQAILDSGAAGGDFGAPPELKGRLDGPRQMWALRRVLKYFGGPYARPAAEYARGLRDPFLRQVIKHLFLPEAPVWFIMMLLGWLAKGELGLLQKGALHFARSIEKRYLELGGEITYRSTATTILTEGGRAAGIRLADGSEHRAGAVVSAADGYSTIFGMLDGRYLDERTKRCYETWPLTNPLVMINYGVRREFPEHPPFNTLILDRPFTVGGREVQAVFVRVFNYSPWFAPPGKTVVQVEFESEWDYWNGLQQDDRPRYDAEKERLAAEMLQRLERHFRDLAGQVEVTDVATPYTTWRYTRNRNGAYMGWLMTPEMITSILRMTLPGLADFVMAGQWVAGGSVPGCLASGRNAARILCRRDRKRFVGGTP